MHEKTFQLLEMVVKKHFQDGRHIDLRDSFKKVIAEIGELNLLKVCCEKHPDTQTYLIIYNGVIRFHFESKRFKNTFLSSVQSNVHKNRNK